MDVLNYTFDWGVLWRQPYGAMLVKGVLTTIRLSLLAWVMAVVLGVIVGVLRVAPSRWGRLAGSAYVQLFRNTPLLVQIFFWYFAAPLLLPQAAQKWLYDNIPDYSFWAAVAALGTYTASRVAEQFRAGLSAIPADQYRAAYSTGMTTMQVYRHVIVPYAFRIIIPPFTTEFLTCFKNSALAMTIGVMEITHTAYYIDSFTWRGLETTTAASLTYLMISGVVALGMSFAERGLHIPGMIARGR